MNLEEIFGDIVKPCSCSNCLSITGYIYQIVGTSYYIRMRELKDLKCWIGCPWKDRPRKISLEELFDNLSPEHQVRFLFKINLLR